jgi:phage baseplate assembly protein W
MVINNFMASVVIDTLNVKQKSNQPIYKDIRLDLNIGFEREARLHSKNTVVDIQASNDVDAVKNSLYNLFTTIPGQKILNPVYGLNLLQFVFTGITDINANLMGNLILEGVSKFEPRLVVKKIFIFPDIENQTYEIGLRLDVPSLNVEGISLRGAISESGFYFN